MFCVLARLLSRPLYQLAMRTSRTATPPGQPSFVLGQQHHNMFGKLWPSPTLTRRRQQRGVESRYPRASRHRPERSSSTQTPNDLSPSAMILVAEHILHGRFRRTSSGSPVSRSLPFGIRQHLFPNPRLRVPRSHDSQRLLLCLHNHNYLLKLCLRYPQHHNRLQRNTWPSQGPIRISS